MNKPIISLCLPTNGIIEWVFPVLDSIYTQDVEQSLFEVIVTDNGKNEEFQKLMTEYAKKYDNLVYKITDCYMFYNQLEALKIASGSFLKLINHRCTFTENSLQYLIDVINKNMENKPVIYFSCGALKEKEYKLDNFDSFVKTLARYASWTTGVGIWKEDYEKLPADIKIDSISPHSCILFAERKKNNYLIDNYVFCEEIERDHRKKGNYDLYKAFGIEEYAITLKLFLDGDISYDTLKSVKEDYKLFLCDLFWTFSIRKKPCSYKLEGFEDAMGIFFKKNEIVHGAYKYGISGFLKKIFHKIFFIK